MGNQTTRRFAQTLISGVECGVARVGRELFGRRRWMNAVGMHERRAGKKLLFEGIRVQPRTARFVEQGEVVGHN